MRHGESPPADGEQDATERRGCLVHAMNMMGFAVDLRRQLAARSGNMVGLGMNIGVIGLGRMGSIFAKRLIEQQHIVHVWNRSAERLKGFVGGEAILCDSPAAVVRKSEVVLVSLANETALDEVYRRENGILAGCSNGCHIVETSTVRPNFIIELAKSVTESGGVFVDAPILGTLGPAREGKVVVVAGGDDAAIERIRPVASGLSRRLFHMGPIGSGSSMKLVVNMCLGVYWQSLGEAIAMGERRGLDLDRMLDVLVDSPIATAALNGKLPVLRGAPAEIGFDITGVRKDLSSALITAHAEDVPAAAAAGALAGFVAAIEGGFGGKDVASIVAFNRLRKATPSC